MNIVFKIKILSLLLITFLFISCSLFNNEESGNDVYGIWYSNSKNVGMKISITDDTIAVNPFVSNGAISVSGSYNLDLNYMYINNINYNNQYIYITNAPTALVSNLTIYIIIDLSSNVENVIAYIYDSQIGYINLTDTIDYIFDGKTITINSASISSDNLQLTINGSNSLETVELRPGSENIFYLPEESWYNDPTSLTIKNSNTVIWDQTLHYNGEINTTDGTISMQELWNIDDLNWNYDLVDKNTLVLYLDHIICQSSDDECKNSYLWNFNIDPALVNTISLVDEREFKGVD